MAEPTETDVTEIVKQAVAELLARNAAGAAPAHAAQLAEERTRREALEKRVNELVTENRNAKAATAEAQRGSEIRAELQKLGVKKVDLAYKAVQDEITRTEEGKLMAGEQPAGEYLAKFVAENPEFLPARITGGSGTPAGEKAGTKKPFDIDSINASMTKEQLEAARLEILRVAADREA